LLSPGKLATAMYVPAVTVGKVQEYAVVGRVKPEVSTDGVVVVQAIVRPVGLVTLQDIDPAGSGLDADVPATRAERVLVPPSVGELEDESVIVGTRVEMPSVTEFDVAAL